MSHPHILWALIFQAIMTEVLKKQEIVTHYGTRCNTMYCEVTDYTKQPPLRGKRILEKVKCFSITERKLFQYHVAILFHVYHYLYSLYLTIQISQIRHQAVNSCRWLRKTIFIPSIKYMGPQGLLMSVFQRKQEGKNIYAMAIMIKNLYEIILETGLMERLMH